MGKQAGQLECACARKGWRVESWIMLNRWKPLYAASCRFSSYSHDMSRHVTASPCVTQPSASLGLDFRQVMLWALLSVPWRPSRNNLCHLCSYALKLTIQINHIQSWWFTLHFPADCPYVAIWCHMSLSHHEMCSWNPRCSSDLEIRRQQQLPWWRFRRLSDIARGRPTLSDLSDLIYQSLSLSVIAKSWLVSPCTICTICDIWSIWKCS